MSDKERRAIELFGAKTLLRQFRIETQKLIESYPELTDQQDEHEDDDDLLLARLPGSSHVKALASGAAARAELLTAAKQAAAAHAKPRGLGRTARDAVRTKVLSSLARGEYLPDIHRQYGVHVSVIRNWAKKAGIPISKIPTEERGRRILAGKGFASGSRRNKTNGEVDGASGAAVRSDNVGRETLKWIQAKGGKVTLRDIAKAFGMRVDSMRFRLNVRRKAGHVIPQGNGEWEITQEGIAFANG